MEIERTQYQTCDVIALRGHVHVTDVPALDKMLQRLLDVERYQILLDLSACTYIGSSGLALLINFANSCRRWKRGDLYLVDPHASIQNVLRVAGLLSEDRSFFQIYASVDEAMEAFSASAG